MFLDLTCPAMRRNFLPLLAGVSLLGAAACSDGSGGTVLSSTGASAGTDSAGDGDGDGDDGGFDQCGDCVGNETVTCDQDGEITGRMDCGAEVCVPGSGCLPCAPGSNTCNGNAVHECDDDGTVGPKIEDCDTSIGEVCSFGSCADACTVAAETPSNVGCRFWAADLPNERGLNDASADQWGIVLANASELTADVVIERNTAPLGDAPSLTVVDTATVPPGTSKAIALPRAELTGWTDMTMEPPGPPGTWKSNNSFRITATAPVVVYQFNNFQNSFSNDASLLLPENGLGTVHRVMGYQVANPISTPGFPLPGIPSRSSVSVIAVEDGTVVDIRPSTKTASDGIGIPVAEPGDTITVSLDKWEVANIASAATDIGGIFGAIPGDMTGTVVESNKPVVVFTSNEQSIAPPDLEPPVPQPPNYDGDNCCTDHIEEQVFPASSLGTQYVITHSASRSNGGFIEPDIVRFLAVAEPATVTTSLPAPFDSFALQPGEVFDAWTQQNFTVESSTPIAIGQVLVSQGYTEAFTGDPALTIFPAVDQYRSVYTFLSPPGWSKNYFVIAGPVGQGGGDGGGTGDYKLDGGPLPSSCVTAPAGQVDGVDFESITCEVSVGSHLIEGDQGFGLTVYGYASVGSYAFAGGADVRPIYEVPPVP